MKSLFSCLQLFVSLILAAGFSGLHGDEAEALRQLEETTREISVVRNDAGQVIKIAASNHPNKRGVKPEKPGIGDEEARLLLAFPELEAVFLEAQPMTTSGHAVLREIPKLTDLRLHYLNFRVYEDRPDYPLADAKAALIVNHLPNPLTVLEIKHNFQVSDTAIQHLEPQPELIKLELDTTFSGPEAVEFVRSAEKVENLQLHRTTMSDEDFVRALEPLNQLRILELRPQRPQGEPITAKSLRVLENHPNLEEISIGISFPDTVYEDGLAYLATIPTLKVVHVSGARPALTKDHAAIQALHEARPDLTIITQNGVLGDPGRRFSRDGDYRFGIAR